MELVDCFKSTFPQHKHQKWLLLLYNNNYYIIIYISLFYFRAGQFLKKKKKKKNHDWLADLIIHWCQNVSLIPLPNLNFQRGCQWTVSSTLVDRPYACWKQHGAFRVHSRHRNLHELTAPLGTLIIFLRLFVFMTAKIQNQKPNRITIDFWARYT